jgi:hypothetical protein
MKKIILLVGIVIVGAVITALIDILLFKIYLFAAPTFLAMWLLTGRYRKNFLSKTATSAVKRTEKRLIKQEEPELDEDDSSPHINVQYGPNGVQGMDVGFKGNAPGQPGSGHLNPAEIALDAIGLDRSRQVAAIMSSDSSDATKQMALGVIETDIRDQVRKVVASRKNPKRSMTCLPAGQSSYGISANEGTNSVE